MSYVLAEEMLADVRRRCSGIQGELSRHKERQRDFARRLREAAKRFRAGEIGATTFRNLALALSDEMEAP